MLHHVHQGGEGPLRVAHAVAAAAALARLLLGDAKVDEAAGRLDGEREELAAPSRAYQVGPLCAGAEDALRLCLAQDPVVPPASPRHNQMVATEHVDESN